MSKSTAHRFYAITLSALLTLCTLGGIDHLATPQDGAAQLAQQPTTQRA